MEYPKHAGKVAIVTGANTGIGEVTAKELARAGARVYVACRSEEKAREAIARMHAEVPDADLQFLALDLASLGAVRESVEKFLATGDAVDILVNNAGVAGPRGVTSDGFELAFGVNHLGHFLFTQLLLPKLIESRGRVVTVSSASHYNAKGIDWEAVRRSTKSATGMPEYEVSKLANVLFSAELHRRIHDAGVATFSLHPGVVATDIWSRSWGGKIIDLFSSFFMISAEEGAKTTLHCAMVASEDESGLFWDKSAPRKPSRPARDAALAEVLWQKSLEWTGAPDCP